VRKEGKGRHSPKPKIYILPLHHCYKVPADGRSIGRSVAVRACVSADMLIISLLVKRRRRRRWLWLVSQWLFCHRFPSVSSGRQTTDSSPPSHRSTHRRRILQGSIIVTFRDYIKIRNFSTVVDDTITLFTVAVIASRILGVLCSESELHVA